MHSETRALGYALIAVLLWSTVATAFKVALQHVSVSQLVAGASLFSVLALGAVLSTVSACSWRLLRRCCGPATGF